MLAGRERRMKTSVERMFVVGSTFLREPDNLIHDAQQTDLVRG